MSGKARERAALHQGLLRKKKPAFQLKDGRKVRVLQSALGILDPAKGTVTPRTDGGVDPLWLRVSVDGEEHWYGYVNPPVLVPNGYFEDERPDGSVVRQTRWKEDPEAALRSILADSLGGEV
jgi:hypothetical protein